MQPRNYSHPGAQGVMLLEGSSAAPATRSSGQRSRRGVRPRRLLREDGPGSGEALSVLQERQSECRVGLKQGEPELGTKRRRESEAEGGALTLGNVLAPADPGEQRAARAGVNLRRGT